MEIVSGAGALGHHGADVVGEPQARPSRSKAPAPPPMLPSVMKNGIFGGRPLSFQTCTMWLTYSGSGYRSAQE